MALSHIPSFINGELYDAAIELNTRGRRKKGRMPKVEIVLKSFQKELPSSRILERNGCGQWYRELMERYHDQTYWSPQDVLRAFRTELKNIKRAAEDKPNADLERAVNFLMYVNRRIRQNGTGRL